MASIVCLLSMCRVTPACSCSLHGSTILDKTVEKMSHSQTIFPNILAVPRPPFPLPLEAMLLCVLKQP